MTGEVPVLKRARLNSLTSATRPGIVSMHAIRMRCADAASEKHLLRNGTRHHGAHLIHEPIEGLAGVCAAPVAVLLPAQHEGAAGLHGSGLARGHLHTALRSLSLTSPRVSGYGMRYAMNGGCSCLSEHGAAASYRLTHCGSTQSCHVMSDALPTPRISCAASCYCSHLDAA